MSKPPHTSISEKTASVIEPYTTPEGKLGMPGGKKGPKGRQKALNSGKTPSKSEKLGVKRACGTPY